MIENGNMGCSKTMRFCLAQNCAFSDMAITHVMFFFSKCNSNHTGFLEAYSGHFKILIHGTFKQFFTTSGQIKGAMFLDPVYIYVFVFHWEVKFSYLWMLWGTVFTDFKWFIEVFLILSTESCLVLIKCYQKPWCSQPLDAGHRFVTSIQRFLQILILL